MAVAIKHLPPGHHSWQIPVVACLPACLPACQLTCKAESPAGLMQVSIVFGGLFVNSATVPGPLKWLPSASLIKQAFEGACVNEFKGGWVGGCAAIH
jgi:hypothetical protein